MRISQASFTLAGWLAVFLDSDIQQLHSQSADTSFSQKAKHLLESQI